MPRNFERAFAERPEVLAAWVQLNTAIKAGMDLRRYELATLAAARRLRSSYCCLAHGSVLARQFGEPVREIALDHHAAGLDEVDVAPGIGASVAVRPDRVRCTAKIGSAALRPVGSCAWRVPSTARGKTLMLKVSVAYGGDEVTDVYPLEVG